MQGNKTALEDTFLVESYKKYNAMEIEEETTICKCTIFWWYQRQDSKLDSAEQQQLPLLTLFIPYQ